MRSCFFNLEAAQPQSLVQSSLELMIYVPTRKMTSGARELFPSGICQGKKSYVFARSISDVIAPSVWIESYNFVILRVCSIRYARHQKHYFTGDMELLVPIL